MKISNPHDLHFLNKSIIIRLHYYQDARSTRCCKRPASQSNRNEGEAVKAVDIALRHTDHINTLVNITNRYPFTIVLRQGRYAVDGKSVLGICSLERAKPIVLEAYSDNCDSLMDELQPLLL